jgi:prepilin peptidase CpaA
MNFESLARISVDLAIIGLYGYAGYTDFRFLKIRNGTVLAILATALIGALLVGLPALASSILVGLALFAITLPFWLISGKVVGAGDVKLLAVTGVVAGLSQVFLFAVYLIMYSLVLIVLTFYLRNILLLPLGLSERLTHFASQNRVPYGVPIALSAITMIISGALY